GRPGADRGRQQLPLRPPARPASLGVTAPCRWPQDGAGRTRLAAERPRESARLRESTPRAPPHPACEPAHLVGRQSLSPSPPWCCFQSFKNLVVVIGGVHTGEEA